jgi:hypothetical protein
MSFRDVEKFVKAHAKSTTLQKDFKANPDAVLSRPAWDKILTAAEKKLLKGQNEHAIRKYLGDEYDKALLVNLP